MMRPRLLALPSTVFAALAIAALGACGQDGGGTTSSGSSSGGGGGAGGAGATTASTTSTAATASTSSSTGDGGAGGAGGSPSATSVGGSTAETTGSGGSSGAVTDLGTISGECPAFVTADYTSKGGKIARNSIALSGSAFDENKLTAGGKSLLAAGGGGTPSPALASEIYSFEILHACEKVELKKTPDQIKYADPNGTQTDMIVDASGTAMAVNTTRAYTPDGVGFDKAAASALLKKQLLNVANSTANVASSDKWANAFLHVIAVSPEHADAVEAAYAELPAGDKRDTLVVVTVTEGTDTFLYTN